MDWLTSEFLPLWLLEDSGRVTDAQSRCNLLLFLSSRSSCKYTNMIQCLEVYYLYFLISLEVFLGSTVNRSPCIQKHRKYFFGSEMDPG